MIVRTRHTFFILCFICFSGVTSAQDTLTIMYYNILNYSPAIPENTQNLKGIVHYINPDVFAVNEISNDTSAKHILTYVLNTDTLHHYRKTIYNDGPDTDNMLFYNSDKLSLALQDTIQTELRIIDEYLLYYNDSAYISQHDTVFFDFYVAHLKSSQGYEQDRLGEIMKLENHWNETPSRKNIFLGGDMNFYNDGESALIELLTPGLYQMNDPLDSIANWHDNPLYSHIHTQSTRTRQFGGGASGGLDDRFDFIFVSNDIMQGSNGVRYIPGTYESFGNDGKHLNDSLTALPMNPAIPDSLTYYLYNMSDHLPVIMKTYINFDASIPNYQNKDEEDPIIIYPNPSKGNLIISIKNMKGEVHLEISSLTGLIKKYYTLIPINDGLSALSIGNLENGVYIARIIINNKYFSKKIIVLK
jgi:hypothetical protein